MKIFKVLVVILFIALIIPLASGQNVKKEFSLVDLRKIHSISSPAISPDGKKVAIIVSKPVWKTDKNKQELVLLKIATRKKRILSRHRISLGNLRWSPKGTKLAFLAKDPKSKKVQIFIMPMNGGDALQATHSKTGVARFEWSPDGKNIAFIAHDTIPNPKAIKHNEDAFKVTDNNYLTRAQVQPWHLWLVKSNGKDAKQLTHGKWSLGTDQGSLSAISWSSDGQHIVFTKFPDVWEGNAWHSVLGEVNLKTGKITVIVDKQGATNAHFAPGKNIIAFSRPKNGDQNNGNAIYIMKENKIIDVTADLNRNINNYIWSSDAAGLILSGYEGTSSVIWYQPLNGKAKKLSTGDVEVNAYSMQTSGNREIVFTGSTYIHPDELYFKSSYPSTPTTLTDYNAFADSLQLGESVTVNWNGPDGFKEDGVLTYPPAFEKGKKYPLVLVIHGGPESASILRFSSLVQLLAAKGFLVFQPNYRGSTNLGNKYQHAIFRDTGKGPGEDVMAGLKKVESMGIVDKSRIGVTGWSYGGYMTSWLIGKYPNVWKAAVSGAALNDWVMDYTIAYYQKGDLYFFGGSPWVKKYWKIWRKQSPIEYADRAKAPTLIMGDVGDPNVPIVNSYQMYHALRDNGVKVDFYVYPVNTHFPHDIVRTTDVYRRWVDWMVKYLK